MLLLLQSSLINEKLLNLDKYFYKSVSRQAIGQISIEISSLSPLVCGEIVLSVFCMHVPNLLGRDKC